MDKAPDAFRTISEVAEDLDLPQHVLRFWETRFSQIRPLKRGGGRRYYRPEDVELLRGIRQLLYGQGYTIKGVQRILREQGQRTVMEIGRNPGMTLPNAPQGGTTEDAEEQEAADAFRDEEEEDAALRTAERAARPETAPAQTRGADEPLPAGILPEGAPARGGFRFMDRFRGGGSGDHGGGGALSREDIRRLQSTLFELLECKRLLDQTR